MNLRPPAYPLITVDPYFSVWAETDKLTDGDTVHWTARPNRISGIAEIDGTAYRFMGAAPFAGIPVMKQTSSNADTFSTYYTFEAAGVRLSLKFTSPVIPDDFYLISRPVSYLEIKEESTDGKKHKVSVKIAVSEQICMNLAGDSAVSVETLTQSGISSVKMGTVDQKMLTRSGDDLRIEWGYFYLSAKGMSAGSFVDDGMTYVFGEMAVKGSALFTFAYDDIKSIDYFGGRLSSYWNKDGSKITDEIAKAHADYKETAERCRRFSNDMFADATRAGGEKYAELLELALRQVIAAHKLAVDTNGEILFISKECYSNGCAATVDVSYPSIPLFLIYNPELVRGMMRPVYRFARTPEWKYDFAPHDAGRYPFVTGQMYGKTPEGLLLHEKQMPVEECGNMLIMEAAAAIATGSVEFAKQNIDLLEKWVKYLIEKGPDPDNQLCTDDFAGHLAHNCNLSLKAIMGIASLGIIYGMDGRAADKKKMFKIARDMAKDWAACASNGDGSYRLCFDGEDSFSMKYNIVWDKLFGTEIMPREIIASEFASYKKRMHPYGMPLDNRQPYTKSDWLVWTATLAENKDDFIAFVEPLWNFINYSPSRVPMTDWYFTVTGQHKCWTAKNESLERSFRNRTVQGGLFIKLLEYKQIMKLK